MAVEERNVSAFDRLFRDDDMYWNPRRTRSYNSLYNFIVGMRGAGKTFGALADCSDRFDKGKGKFIYLRRYSTELDGLTNGPMPALFSKVQSMIPEHKWECKNNMFYMDDEHCGWAVPLSTSNIMKSFDFMGVSTIIFDEFIIDNRGVYHYIKKEVNLFNTFYQTVVRDMSKFVPVFFLSNAVSISNPYFDFYHLDKPADGQRIRRFGANKGILVENVVPPRNAEKVRNSAWFDINAGSEYAEYAVDNQWLLDNEDFVEKKPYTVQYDSTLRYNGHDIGVWIEPSNWVYYISNDVEANFPRYFAVTADDHKPNVLLLQAAKKLPVIHALKTAYEAGAVRYETMKLKNEFKDIMRLCRGYQ